MRCVCGHHRASHINTGWPRYAPYCDSFTCCDRKPNRSIGRSGSEHDFINHQISRCKCESYQQEGESK